MKFYLGTHVMTHLEQTEVPLFVSVRQLKERRLCLNVAGTYALDSGGFSELSLYGQWITSPQSYVRKVRRLRLIAPGMEWAATQDYMCEPEMIARTGLTVYEHQRRTVDSYLTLRDLDPSTQWLPVLQGYTIGDYVRHVGDYASVGVNLAELPRVGVGSICRRQATQEAADILRELSSFGIRLHAFGLKQQGLRLASAYLESADSMAWSIAARKSGTRLPECHHKGNCANCLRYALSWRDTVLECIEAGTSESA